MVLAVVPSEPILLSPAEVARLLGVSRPKVYTLIADGRLSSVHIDGSRRIFRDSVDAYLKTLREDGGRRP